MTSLRTVGDEFGVAENLAGDVILSARRVPRLIAAVHEGSYYAALRGRLDMLLFDSYQITRNLS